MTMVTETFASGEEVGMVVRDLEAALEGKNGGHAIIAMLSLVVVMQKPDIQPEDLAVVVRDTSRFICMSLEGTGSIENDPAQEPVKIVMN